MQIPGAHSQRSQAEGLGVGADTHTFHTHTLGGLG